MLHLYVQFLLEHLVESLPVGVPFIELVSVVAQEAQGSNHKHQAGEGWPLGNPVDDGLVMDLDDIHNNSADEPNLNHREDIKCPNIDILCGRLDHFGILSIFGFEGCQ